MRDLEMFEIISREEKRQKQNVELIASENYVSSEVREAQGSVLTNKYAEGYPGKRYYGGCVYVDQAKKWRAFSTPSLNPAIPYSVWT